jgi:hypothetical protein
MHTIRENTFSGDDNEYGATEKLKAKFCIHTLAFKDIEFYNSICKGSKLTSPLTKHSEVTESKLNVNYDELYNLLNQKTDLQTQRENKRAAICAFRDYGRKNLVFYLTQQLSH